MDRILLPITINPQTLPILPQPLFIYSKLHHHSPSLPSRTLKTIPQPSLGPTLRKAHSEGNGNIFSLARIN